MAQRALTKVLLVLSAESNPDGLLLKGLHHHIRTYSEGLKGFLQTHNTVQELFSQPFPHFTAVMLTGMTLNKLLQCL